MRFRFDGFEVLGDRIGISWYKDVRKARAYGKTGRVGLHCVCCKKCTIFETVQLKITRINFDDVWLKYSKYSRIEFVCFNFRVGLHFCQLFLVQTRHRK